MGRDVFEYILGQIGPAGAVYQAMEFTGPVVEDMSLDGRLSMCCLSIFTGAKTGIVNPDQKVFDWFKTRTKVHYKPQVSDPDAQYAKVYNYDGSKIEPQVVVPPYDAPCSLSPRWRALKSRRLSLAPAPAAATRI